MALFNTKTVMAAMLVLALGACSSTGAITMQQEKTASIPAGKSVSLNVESDIPPDANESQISEFKEITQRVKAALFGRLVSEGVFKQVLQPTETGDYRMNVTLKSAYKVSQGARILVGVFAGSNKLDADVELIDESTKSTVTAFQVVGESASHPFSTESGLDDAVREAADEILLALQ